MLYMTPNILKNFLHKKATRGYPFEVRDPFPGYRGELVNDPDTCILCTMCSKKCPSQCIAVDREKQTWTCDPYACVYCGVCVENCPVHSLSMVNQHRKPAAAKAAYEVKGAIRKKASKAPTAPGAEPADKKPTPKKAPAKKGVKKDTGGEDS